MWAPPSACASENGSRKGSSVGSRLSPSGSLHFRGRPSKAAAITEALGPGLRAASHDGRIRRRSEAACDNVAVVEAITAIYGNLKLLGWRRVRAGLQLDECRVSSD